MTKQIRLEEHVYLTLEGFRNKKETYSEAVERLLQLPTRIKQLGDIIEGAKSYEENRRARAADQARDLGAGVSPSEEVSP